MTQQLKVLAAKLKTRIQSLGHAWCKEKVSSSKLSSDFQVHAVAWMHPHTYTFAYMHENDKYTLFLKNDKN